MTTAPHGRTQTITITVPERRVVLPVPSRTNVVLLLGVLGAVLLFATCATLDRTPLTWAALRPLTPYTLTGILLLAAAHALYATAPGRRA
ncbi:hypothetical protein [Deinococcus soli (ex Cha et al. 2016)]|uniref:hypothetical protein n=1 Tax=Deinococcus soli (ex Cha et al. 2016) TaxID=1309411 RepID=UPI001663B477|nr:hypothetical protein [Deinococcus soli (ex Cha et al. 2016)]GGB68997.1 hypothetical protein GCM10008019_26520 [Deinococcus soli (ex Cha et al. 2016)]